MDTKEEKVTTLSRSQAKPQKQRGKLAKNRDKLAQLLEDPIYSTVFTHAVVIHPSNMVFHESYILGLIQNAKGKLPKNPVTGEPFYAYFRVGLIGEIGEALVASGQIDPEDLHEAELPKEARFSPPVGNTFWFHPSVDIDSLSQLLIKERELSVQFKRGLEILEENFVSGQNKLGELMEIQGSLQKELSNIQAQLRTVQEQLKDSNEVVVIQRKYISDERARAENAESRALENERKLAIATNLLRQQVMVISNLDADLKNTQSTLDHLLNLREGQPSVDNAEETGTQPQVVPAEAADLREELVQNIEQVTAILRKASTIASQGPSVARGSGRASELYREAEEKDRRRIQDVMSKALMTAPSEETARGKGPADPRPSFFPRAGGAALSADARFSENEVRVAIVGGKQSGKSCLLQYLLGGFPLGKDITRGRDSLALQDKETRKTLVFSVEELNCTVPPIAIRTEAELSNLHAVIITYDLTGTEEYHANFIKFLTELRELISIKCYIAMTKPENVSAGIRAEKYRKIVSELGELPCVEVTASGYNMDTLRNKIIEDVYFDRYTPSTYCGYRLT